MNNHTASLEITVNMHEFMLSQKLVFWTSNRKHVIKYDTIFTLNFHKILHIMYKCVLNSAVIISLMFAKYFEYYTIILRGPFFRGHAV